ncbi:MAG: ATP-binding protein [Oscillospiraceae bacterium]|nr:ATP-binding protein [Oscillospiraceae bacterium]
MGFRKTFYIQAREQIKARKTAAENLLAKRNQEITEKYPEFGALLPELAGTIKELMDVIFAGKADVTQKVKAIEEKNAAIRVRIEEILTEGRFPQNYLRDVNTCPKCLDNGVYGDRYCDCFYEIVKNLAANELNKSSPLRLSSFEAFDLELYPDKNDDNTGQNMRQSMSHNFNFCKQYADDFHLPHNGILMCGGTGLGKTHLSLAIAGVVLDKGYGVIYGSTPDLLRKIEKEHFYGENETDTLELLEEADLLVLDDLGAEFDSGFYTATLYNLVNSRMNRGTPTIINTNLDFKTLKTRYNDRIMSRLMTSKVLLFFGRDIRILTKF